MRVVAAACRAPATRRCIPVRRPSGSRLPGHGRETDKEQDRNGPGHGARPVRPSLPGDGRGSVGRGGPARAVQERPRRRCRPEAGPLRPLSVPLVRASCPRSPSRPRLLLSGGSLSGCILSGCILRRPTRHPLPASAASCPPAASRSLPGTRPLSASRRGVPRRTSCCVKNVAPFVMMVTVCPPGICSSGANATHPPSAQGVRHVLQSV